MSGTTDEEVINKELRRLKNDLVLYDIYKKGQAALFMSFHLVTIVVTLLLSILSTSLFSFGYITCCLYMIYENPKFFAKEQKGYKLNSLLYYFLRPYVFFDITLLIIY